MISLGCISLAFTASSKAFMQANMNTRVVTLPIIGTHGTLVTSQDRQILSSCKPVMRIDNRCNLLTIRIQVFRFSNYELYY
jgi:hypothetical protein